jgi:HPt (histidine-containing phosphotransfer) domain-containing protein
MEQMALAESRNSGPRHVVCLDKDIEPIVTRFLGRKRAEIPRLRAALQGQDFEEIRRLGHDLKGAGEGFGFPDLTVVGEQLERSARSRDRKTITEQIDAMDRYLASVEVHYS